MKILRYTALVTVLLISSSTVFSKPVDQDTQCIPDGTCTTFPGGR